MRITFWNSSNSLYKRKKQGPALWHNGITFCLQWQQPNTGVPVWVMAILLLIQLPINMPWKVGDDGSSSWTSATHIGEPHGVAKLVFCLVQPWLLWPCGSEPMEERSFLALAVSLLLSMLLVTSYKWNQSKNQK